MSKKANIILVIILIILIVIFVTLSLLMYFNINTDLFKNKEEIFFDKLVYLTTEESKFIDSNLSEYLDKKQNNTYTSMSSIDIDMDVDGEKENIVIDLDGVKNESDNKAYQDIVINYSDNVNLKLSYAQNQELIGIQSDVLTSKYIVSNEEKIAEYDDVNNVKAILENIENFTKILEVENVNFTEINEMYFETMKQFIPDDKYIAEEVENSDVLIVNVSIKEIAEMINTLNGLNQENNDINQNTIEWLSCFNIIELFDIDIEKDSDKNVELRIYFSEEELSKLKMTLDTSKIISFEKVTDTQNPKYIYNLKDLDKYDILISKEYRSITSGNEITEKINIEYIDNINNQNLEIKIEEKINFVESTDKFIEFTNENALFLNERELDVVNPFLQTVEDRLKAVSEKNMIELGKETDPLTIMSNILNDFSELKKLDNENSEDVEEGNDKLEEDINNENTEDTPELQSISDFNKELEVYESTNSPGVTVKGLFTEIKELNLNNQELKVSELSLEGEEYIITDETIDQLKNKIITETIYKVGFEKDQETGQIYRVVITVKPVEETQETE